MDLRLRTHATRLVARSRVRRDRNRLAEQDRRSARLAELSAIAEMLEGAGTVVAAGWRQGEWYDGWRDGPAQPGTGTPPACLVGGVILAAGGPHQAHTQVVQRSLDLLWHVFGSDPRPPVGGSVPAHVRLHRVRQLAAWNDAPGRRAEDVWSLLDRAAAVARAEAARLRRHPVSQDVLPVDAVEPVPAP